MENNLLLVENVETTERMAIIFEMQSGEIIRFDCNPEAMDDANKRPAIIEDILNKVKTCDLIDELIKGDDAMNVYSIKRTIPNRRFKLHVAVEGELVNFSLRNKLLPTAALHDYDLLRNILKCCFLFKAPAMVQKLAKEKPKTEAKKLTAAQKELAQIRTKERADAKRAIKEERMAKSRAERRELLR